MHTLFHSLSIVILLSVGCGSTERKVESKTDANDNTGTSESTAIEVNDKSMKNQSDTTYQMATFGAGCFWCVEAVFQELRGVKYVESGYAGGTIENPSYEQVSSGASGHAEVCQITFDPDSITYKELLEVFWKTHDPTTMNKQGADVGTQYRSIILYHDDTQKALAEKYKEALNESGAWDNPVVTEIKAYSTFYPAEKYHQDYFQNNTNQPYCKFVIQPKLDKFRKAFEDKLK